MLLADPVLDVPAEDLYSDLTEYRQVDRKGLVKTPVAVTAIQRLRSGVARMAFEAQNILEQSLMRAASDPAHRPQFYKDLADSDLFIIQPRDESAIHGRMVLKANEVIQIQTLQWNDKEYIPVFSSLLRLRSVLQGEANYLAMNAIELMKITLGKQLVLNPGCEYGKELVKDEIASIIDGTIWNPSKTVVLKKATEVLLGQPARYPTELVDALSRLFKMTKQVKRAYVAHYVNPSTHEDGHTLIAVEVTGDWDTVMAKAGMVARDVPSPDPPIDFLQLQGNGGFDDYFYKQCKPFYEKKLFGIF